MVYLYALPYFCYSHPDYPVIISLKQKTFAEYFFICYTPWKLGQYATVLGDSKGIRRKYNF